MGEECLNLFMREVPIVQNPVKDLRHERVNALLRVCIHRDMFLDYDKIIDIYASKYPRRMHLINPLSEN